MVPTSTHDGDEDDKADGSQSGKGGKSGSAKATAQEKTSGSRVKWIDLLVKIMLVVKVGRVVVMKVERTVEVQMERMVLVKVGRVVMTENTVVTATSCCGGRENAGSSG